MPFKARQFYHRRNKAPKMQPKRDWSDYNKKMKMRGDMTIWLSPDVIKQWVIAASKFLVIAYTHVNLHVSVKKPSLAVAF